jgi:hypothetical protein
VVTDTNRKVTTLLLAFNYAKAIRLNNVLKTSKEKSETPKSDFKIEQQSKSGSNLLYP